MPQSNFTGNLKVATALYWRALGEWEACLLESRNVAIGCCRSDDFFR